MLVRSGFPSLRRVSQLNLVRRPMSTKVHRLPKEDEGQDFRPPWVYTWTRAMSYIVIPGTAFYAIFVYDFGEREHVFQPARRWAAKQKAAFFTLSPAEEKLLKAVETQSSEPPSNAQETPSTQL